MDFPRFGAFNKKETFTSSGTFTPPVTGIYKITLQGGGGGGGGAGQSSYGWRGGGGGGSGACGVFYETLTAGISYAFTVGAGGTPGRGSNDGTSTNGSSGGSSSITINDNSYVAGGGEGGYRSSGAHYGIGGDRGQFYINSVQTEGSGFAGCTGDLRSGSYGLGGNGGGPGGRHSASGNDGGSGAFGGGGAGGTSRTDSTNYNGGYGGDGYITFEYCDVA